MKKIFIFLFFIYFFSKFTFSVYAQVVINEISVEPNDKQDWVEFYSIEDTDVSGWIVGDESGDFYTFPVNTSILKNHYVSITKYQRLNNDGDTVYLFNSAHNLIDSISYGRDGQVCIPGSEESIARIPDGGNTYDRIKVATKDTSNNNSEINLCPPPTPPTTNTPTSTPSPSNTPTHIPTQKPSASVSVTLPITATSKISKVPTPTVSGIVLSDTTGAQGELISESLPSVGGNYNSDLSLGPTSNVLEATVSGQTQKKLSILPLLLIIFGTIVLGLSFIPAVKNYKKRKGNELIE